MLRCNSIAHELRPEALGSHPDRSQSTSETTRNMHFLGLPFSVFKLQILVSISRNLTLDLCRVSDRSGWPEQRDEAVLTPSTGSSCWNDEKP